MSASGERPLHAASARAAAAAGRHDALVRELEARLIDSLEYHEGKPSSVLDAGCGTGHGGALLKQRWRDAAVIALDLSLPMLRQARRRSGWRHRFDAVCADALQLPLLDRSVDVVYSNLCLPWCGPPKPLFREFARVLKPGGFVVASSLGPDSLAELRAAWMQAGRECAAAGPFIDMHDLGDAALAAGLKDPVLDTDHLTLHYADVRALLESLRGFGAPREENARSLVGSRRFKAMLAAYEALRRDERIPATWEVVTMHARGFPEGAMPLYGGRDTPFEVISRRAPRRR